MLKVKTAIDYGLVHNHSQQIAQKDNVLKGLCNCNISHAKLLHTLKKRKTEKHTFLARLTCLRLPLFCEKGCVRLCLYKPFTICDMF